MPNAIVSQMLEEMDLGCANAEEVFKYHSTLLIEDFRVPASYVVDMMYSLKEAVRNKSSD